MVIGPYEETYFVRMPVRVMAFQITAENIHRFTNLLRLHKDAGEARLGDWVVQESDEFFSIQTDESFRKEYCPSSPAIDSVVTIGDHIREHQRKYDASS